MYHVSNPSLPAIKFRRQGPYLTYNNSMLRVQISCAHPSGSGSATRGLVLRWLFTHRMVDRMFFDLWLSSERGLWPPGLHLIPPVSFPPQAQPQLSP